MSDQESRRKELFGLLGDLPDRDRPISSRVLSVSEEKTYILERLVLDLNSIESVPAYFVRPLTDGPYPCVLYNHAHGGDYQLGKDELIRGRDLLQQPPYAEALAQKGIATLCIDAWLFGERHGLTESEQFKEMLWHGQVLWGMMVFDSLRAMDYLCSRPDIDTTRIGTLGLSMGSTMAWWLAALDPRIKVCVDICCLTDFQSLIESRGLDGHGIYYYVPSLLKHFTTSQINALIAPRPHLSLAGNYDRLTPQAGLERVDREIKAVYKELGCPDAWELKRFNVGHFETAEMRADILAFLDKWL
ncbi:MAG TPA: acetylxylan esterase [Anaerolineales bacterium]|nr:acetylxylan esterase [Anaerolineales bacterium]